jgi:GT2 family glycosyltransferase
MTVGGNQGPTIETAFSPSTDLSKVCGVIVTYRPGEFVWDCIGALSGQVGQVIVVDNGSDPEAIQRLTRLEVEGRIAAIYNRVNLGIAHALNQGIRCAMDREFRWVLILDHDSVATPGMVRKLVRVFENLGDRVGIFDLAQVDELSPHCQSGEENHTRRVTECLGSAGRPLNV